MGYPQKHEILNDLKSVGPSKPIGYLPLGTIRKLGADPKKIASDAKKRGLKTKFFTEEESHTYHGALFVYDYEQLQKLLTNNQKTLKISHWPSHPDKFIDKVAREIAPRHTNLFNLVADAFSDKTNRIRKRVPFPETEYLYRKLVESQQLKYSKKREVIIHISSIPAIIKELFSS